MKSLGHIVSGSWSTKQCLVWDSSHRMDLKSNQTLAGYSHKFCVTIALEYIASMTNYILKVLGLGW